MTAIYVNLFRNGGFRLDFGMACFKQSQRFPPPVSLGNSKISKKQVLIHEDKRKEEQKIYYIITQAKSFLKVSKKKRANE